MTTRNNTYLDTCMYGILKHNKPGMGWPAVGAGSIESMTE